MKIPPEDWFQWVNREFREQDVAVGQRPFLALDRYCKDFRVRALPFDAPAAKAIFDWFSSNTKPESHHIGALFTGAFYYDASFWAVDIPIGYGRFKLDAPNSLRGMPHHVKQELMTHARDAWSYVQFWVDCLDYAYGFDDIQKDPACAPFGLALLENADRELRAAISQLLEHRPNPKAAMSARMATEMYLKAFLVQKSGFTEADVKKFNHRLRDIVRECARVASGHDIVKIENDLNVFPEIHERYTGTDVPAAALWRAYGLAQYCGAAFTRSFSDRDTRSQFQTKAL